MLSASPRVSFVIPVRDDARRLRVCLASIARNIYPAALVEVVVDPFEPPMPPKVSVKQALHFAEALAKGQPKGGKIALTLFRDKINELL